MNHSPIGLTITEMTVPESPAGQAAEEFRTVVALGNRVCLNDSGLNDFAATPKELLSQWRDRTDYINRVFVARVDGEVVGAVRVCHALAEQTSAEVDLMVLPQNWGRGVEVALLDQAEDEVHRLGRRIVQAWTLHPADASAASLSPRTGFGRITATPYARLLADRGYELEQVERSSAFDLAADAAPIQRMLEEALGAAGAEYRIVEWTLPTPPELREGYAWALSRMSTDVPAGGLEIDEETWDADRLRRRDAQFDEGGQTVSVTAALHVPTGALAAFNELVIGADPTDVTHQYCTLVLKEHRGHRLGIAVKCANILRWRAIAPLSPRISTFNAEENRPMLAINEAMGFTPSAYSGAWQKRLG